MDENKASDLHLDMPKAASSHNAVESSHENEPVGTGAAAAPHGFCFRLCSYIVCPIVLLIILVALLIWCPYVLLAKLMGSRDVLSLKKVAKNLAGCLCVKAGDGNTSDFGFGELEKQYQDLNWATAATAALRQRFLLLLLPWLVIVVSVPGLKQITVLGLPLWKWTVTVALVVYGYHAISSLSQLTVKKLSRKMIKDKYDVVYYADGLRRSVNNVIFCVFILLAWELYFRSSRHGLRRYGFSEKALDIGTWTAISLLVDAFLVLAKNAAILSWKSHAIYRQFTDNIGKAGLQLYFLGLVSGSKFDIFSPREEGEDKGAGEAMNKPAAEENNGKQEDGNEKKNKVKGAGECSGKEDDKKEYEEEEKTTNKEQEIKTNENEEGKKINGKKQRKMDREEREQEKTMKKEQEQKEKMEKKEQDKEKKEMEKEQKQEKKKTEEANRFMSMNSKISYASTYQKKQMAKYFILAARLSSRKDDTVPEEIRKQWERFKQDDSEYITRNNVIEIVSNGNVKSVEKEINLLFKELKYADEFKDKELKYADKPKDKGLKDADKLKDKGLKDQNVSSKDRIRYSTFEEWMTRAFKNCLSLGYTLSDATDAVNNLNNIMAVFLKIMVFLCWLLLTGIASTKALIAFASPILAATFIFGDTLKAAFEGIIFTFVTHPFIIGDLCIIDGTQLEVKQMDVLKTTFQKIDSKEKVLYPNKVLAEKIISNLEKQLECKDYVELCLNRSVDINSLEDEIKKILEGNDMFEEGYVVTKEIGETIKIAIHFKHVMSIEDDTHAQHLKKKEEQRSKLLNAVLEKIQTKDNFSAKKMAESSG